MWVTGVRNQKQAVETLTNIGGVVRYDHQTDGLLYADDSFSMVYASMVNDPPMSPDIPRWSLGLLGNEYFQDVACVHLSGSNNVKKTTGWLDSLDELPRMRRLSVFDLPVDDDDLAQISRSKRLVELVLVNREFDAEYTDNGLRHLGDLHELQSLNLRGADVSDQGLEHLQGLRQLKHLTLDSPHITNAGLDHLKKLKNLNELSVSGTEVTEEGARHLLRSLPSLKRVFTYTGLVQRTARTPTKRGR